MLSRTKKNLLCSTKSLQFSSGLWYLQFCLNVEVCFSVLVFLMCGCPILLMILASSLLSGSGSGRIVFGVGQSADTERDRETGDALSIFIRYQTAASFISGGGCDKWLAYPPLVSEKDGLGPGPKTSADIVCIDGPVKPGSGLGESPCEWEIMSVNRCPSPGPERLLGWCPGSGCSSPPSGVAPGPEEGTNPRSIGVWAWEEGGPWGKKS